jgi:lysyl-tRNA synthetase class 1
MTDLAALARHSNAWPFVEARALWDERLKAAVPAKGYVLFQTGYGPSGLPHIGTFGEVVRTTMVRKAFELLTPAVKTRLFTFSDDMDGLRKVPDNVPNQDMVRQHLGKPVTSVPDPFGTHESFGAHNNARLRAFLDSFEFDYEFKSATASYKAGEFDKALLRVLEKYDDVINVILPTLGPERRATYSPFLPVSPKTGVVLQVPVVERDLASGTIVYKDEDGEFVRTPVTGGHCKLQWKCDWAMRWYALGVDYEMSGKDLIDSVKLSSQVCRILGGTPPLNLTFELFNDEQGQKISKSKGNGLAVEDWLKYAPSESLALYMYQKPKTAKRLFFDVIPKAVDEYLDFLEKYQAEEDKAKLDNPAFHIHGGRPPQDTVHVSFSMLLNLASVAHAENSAVLWHYISRFVPGATPESAPLLDRLVRHAIAYYKDFVKPAKVYRGIESAERPAFVDLRDALAAATGAPTPEGLQTVVYEIGKKYPEAFASLRDWFKALYQVLLGQDQGPRMGSFIALYGVTETVRLLDKALAGEDLAKAS